MNKLRDRMPAGLFGAVFLTLVLAANPERALATADGDRQLLS